MVIAIFALVFFCMRPGSKGPSKKTLQKKAKKADKAKEDGSKAKGSVKPATPALVPVGPSQDEEPVPIKKSKKAQVSNEEREAKKAEMERRKKQSLAAFEKNNAQQEKEDKVTGKKGITAIERRAALEEQKSKEELHAQMFQKAQERRKDVKMPAVVTSGGRFAAFDDSD